LEFVGFFGEADLLAIFF